MVASEAALPEAELLELSGAVIPAAEALPPPVQQAEPPVAEAAWPTSQPESDPELPELPAFPALETTLAGQLPDWQDDPELVAQSLVSPSIAGEPPAEVTAVEDEAVPHQSETALEPPVPLDEPTILVVGASDAEPALSLLVPEDEPEAVVEHDEPAALDLAVEPETESVPDVTAVHDHVEAQSEPVVAETELAQADTALAVEEPAAVAADPEPAIEEPAQVAPEPAPVAEERSPTDVQNAAAPGPVAEEAAAQAAPKAEEQENAETKTRASDMAGRVVDAMIKTISTAIYAKPSATERAAFLREMAAFMAEAANESEAKAEAAAIMTRTAAPVAAPPVPTPAAIEAKAAPLAAVIETPVAQVIAQDVPAVAKPAPRAADPFTEPPPRIQDPRPPETPEADEESGELALTLLDMMSGGTSSLPHERTLASDTLLRILPRIPVKQLIAVVERVAIMESPPALLVARLIRDPRPEIVGPLLERCSQISDQDLMNAAPDHDTAKLRMIARRRTLSTVLSDYLIATAEPGVLLTLIRNPAAAFSHDAFFRLAGFASNHHALLAPLATRADLPPPVAFELFWHVPQELRRFIFSRFLTDSETLNKILRITLATHAADASELQTEAKFPTREALDEALASVSAFKLDAAAAKLAELSRISRDTAMRILGDREGEPLTVLLKALGCARARFEEVLGVLRSAEDGILRPDRKPEELQAIFDSLSFNKARILLTYWDWYVRKSGPYAPQN